MSITTQIGASMTDQERKAMEIALEALESCDVDYDNEERQVRTFDAPLVNAAHRALRQALAQPEKEPYADKANQLNSDRMQIDPVTGDVSIGTPSKPEKEKESTPSNVDSRVLLISNGDFTKETGNRLCDIERRLAAIETQSDEANKKPHAVSYKDGVPVAYYNFDPPPYTAPPSKPWVSLTDEEIDYIWGITKADYEDKFDFPRAIEAKLKEKNNG